MTDQNLLLQENGYPNVPDIKAQLRNLNDDSEYYTGEGLLEDAAAHIEHLERELAEARKDAERYRWLAGADVPQYSTRWPRWKLEYYTGFHGGWQPMMGEDLDAAIDESIEKDKP